MKLSAKQIVASMVGSVAAAVIASLISQRGTIIGVAIGAAVTTTTAALVAQSIERGHKVVRQRASDPSGVLRRVGDTQPRGDVDHDVAPSVAEVGGTGRPPARTRVTQGAPHRRTRPESTGTRAGAGAPARRAGITRWRWRTVGLMAGIVFVGAVGVVTAIEALAQSPLSTLVGSGNAKGYSVGNLFRSGRPSPTTTTSTTTTAPGHGATTTTVPSATSLPPATSTTTSSTTTTTTTTTTTVPSPVGGSATTTVP